MIATCVVIVIGFSVLLASAFTPMRTFGGMTAVGLVLAMLCDLFVLSFLLLAFSGQDEWTSIMRKTLLLVLASCMLTAAQAPETGRDIAQKAQVAQFTFKTLKASGEMTLARGSESIGQRGFVGRADRARARRPHYDQARITINAPTALKDTQLISWSSGSGEDQQWLVTPRTQRVQRIADRGRQAAFVSSDFSYEDILKWQVDDYDYTRVGQAPCPAGTCTMVEAKPRNRYSSYTVLKIYYDDAYRISKIDYFGSSAGQAAQDTRPQRLRQAGRAAGSRPAR